MRCIRLGSENIEYELFLPKVVKGCGWKAFDVCKKEEEAFDGEEEFFHKELHCHHIFVRTVENLLGLQSTIALFFFISTCSLEIYWGFYSVSLQNCIYVTMSNNLNFRRWRF